MHKKRNKSEHIEHLRAPKGTPARVHINITHSLRSNFATVCFILIYCIVYGAAESKRDILCNTRGVREQLSYLEGLWITMLLEGVGGALKILLSLVGRSKMEF